MIDYGDPDIDMDKLAQWARLAAEVLGHEMRTLSILPTGFTGECVGIRRANGEITAYEPFNPDSEDSLALLKALTADIKYWKQHIQIGIVHPYWPGGHTTATHMFVKEYTRMDVMLAVLEFFYESHHGWMRTAKRGLTSPAPTTKDHHECNQGREYPDW